MRNRNDWLSPVDVAELLGISEMEALRRMCQVSGPGAILAFEDSGQVWTTRWLLARPVARHVNAVGRRVVSEVGSDWPWPDPYPVRR